MYLNQKKGDTRVHANYVIICLIKVKGRKCNSTTKDLHQRFIDITQGPAKWLKHFFVKK